MQVSPSSQLLAALAAFSEARRGAVSPDEAQTANNVTDQKDKTALPQRASAAEVTPDSEPLPEAPRETRFTREAPAARQQRYQRPGQLIDIEV